MSGLYILVVGLVWLLLTAWLTRASNRWAGRLIKSPVAQNLGWAALMMAWLGVSFWYAGGRKYYYDAWVEEMCAKDGGVKVFERAKLTKEEFERFASRNFVVPSKELAEIDDAFYREHRETVINEGVPKLLRSRDTIIRKGDGKSMGESITYFRIGGAFPGPWHEVGFYCPINQNLDEQIFQKEEIQ